ncbi:hypothetical protein [Streptomyces rhizosphaericus]|uniref:Uncharacterized protein n=1 Tax=Streptomyces rhizosphaericus TaxID=114699 RepID=A0ABN1PPX5_9ACTN|nr:hypothetical protein [Streptomyces cangkringensis]
MSEQGERRAKPSAWAIERFGRQASKLAWAVPVQLARAHARAHAVHLTAGLKKRGPYGSTLAECVRVNLADTARELGESVREIRGFEYAVINDHAVFPYKYANRPRPLDQARLPSNASPTRRRLFRAHGPEPQDGLFELDDDLTTEEYRQLEETFEELGASTKLVCVFFTADPEDGIHAIHWGEARLEPDRTFTWLHSEQLPVAMPPPE